VKVPSKLTIATATLALGLAPAAALAQGNPSQGGNGKSQSAPGHNKTSGSTTTPSSNTRAYGRYCRAESKKHVAGQKGTPFSNCVKDMAQVAKSAKTNPHTVCANESKKHVAGQKGTPYSDCVTAAAKLRGHHTGSSSTGSTSTGSTSTGAGTGTS
jgi:hypothetical protein